MEEMDRAGGPSAGEAASRETGAVRGTAKGKDPADGADRAPDRIDVREKLPVLLSIRAEQDYESPVPDQTELMTEGVMELCPGGMALTYQESALTGMAGTTTTFEVKGPRVILRRTGSVTSQMVFEEGRQHTSLYETPFGELSIDIQTSYLRHTLTEAGGGMEIRYSISVEHVSTGKNRFRVQVKRRGRS